MPVFLLSGSGGAGTGNSGSSGRPLGGGTDLPGAQAGLRGWQATTAGPLGQYRGMVRVTVYTYRSYLFERSDLLAFLAELLRKWQIAAVPNPAPKDA